MTIDMKPNMKKRNLVRIVEEESGLEAPEAESTTIAAAKDEAERNESTEADRYFRLHSFFSLQMFTLLLLQDAADEEAFKENAEEAVFEAEEGCGEEPARRQHCR